MTEENSEKIQAALKGVTFLLERRANMSDLAAVLDVDHSTISRWNAGKTNPKPREVKIMAQLAELGETAGELRRIFVLEYPELLLRALARGRR